MEFKNLCNKIIENFKDKPLFYDLEPILELRDEYITEDILIFIISNIKHNSYMEIINYVKSKLPAYNQIESFTIVHETLNGTIQIYPSELKRANIPINLYEYIIKNPVRYMNNNLDYNLLKTLIPESPRNYIYTKIQNKFKKNIENKIYDNFLVIKILMLFNIKIKECFYYFDSVLYNNFEDYNKKRKILLCKFNKNICSLIESFDLTPNYIMKINKVIHKLLINVVERISKNFNIVNSYDIILYIIQKYFEYRILYFKENKLFNTINYIEIKEYLY
jgi:hypothetical protein